MDKNLDYLNPSCPWSSFEPAVDPFCEQRLCGWISEPANAWTNLAYILVGLVILYIICKKPEDAHFRTFGILAILVGIGSGLLHGTGTWIGSMLDLSAMYFFSSYLVALAARRAFKFSEAFFWTFYLLLCVLSVAIYFNFRFLALHVFGGELAIWILLDLFANWHIWRVNRPQLKYLYCTSVFFVVAFGVWQLDTRKIWCDANNHAFNGHAAWHLINCFCYYFLYRYYRQFRELAKDTL